MDNQRKRLRYQSWHRGTKELDFLLGKFFDAQEARFSSKDLTLYQQLLEEDDYDLYQWLTINASAFPKHYDCLIKRIQVFHQHKAMP